VAVAKRRKVGNLLALSLLSLLSQRPMYPYEMAQTLRARGKDQNFKLNWGSLYTVVANLSKYGFIEETGTVREGRQPERTTYQITDLGLAELRDWLTELLTVPEDEHGGFVAALSEAGILSPDEVIGLLAARLTTLEKANAVQQDDLRQWIERLPRIFLIEAEYQLAMRVAQSNWLRGLLTELSEGTISGMAAWRQIHETGEIPPEFEELDERAKRGWDETPPDAAHDQQAHDQQARDQLTHDQET
jgi:DNA-binding PadR family transcriptional regulator